MSNTILYKVFTLVLMTANGPEFFVSTTTIFQYDSYDALEDNIIHMKRLKLKRYPRENVTDFCTAILVDDEILESDGAHFCFKILSLGNL